MPEPFSPPMDFSVSYEDYREPIFSIEIDYHADFGSIVRDALRMGVLVQDLPTNWAGRVRFVGYMMPLCHLLEDNWGPADEIAHEEDQDGKLVPIYQDWSEFVLRMGKEV